MSDFSTVETPVSTDGVAPTGRQWVTDFQDSGETVEWVASTYNADGTVAIPGTVKEGTFVGTELVELKEDQINPDKIDPETGEPETHATLLVFEDEHDERWNTWESYQIKAERFQEGSYYRIECKRERKTAKGAMKSFKIMRDASVR